MNGTELYRYAIQIAMNQVIRVVPQRSCWIIIYVWFYRFIHCFITKIIHDGGESDLLINKTSFLKSAYRHMHYLCAMIYILYIYISNSITSLQWSHMSVIISQTTANSTISSTAVRLMIKEIPKLAWCLCDVIVMMKCVSTKRPLIVAPLSPPLTPSVPAS